MRLGAALLLALPTPLAAQTAAPIGACDGKPVLMVIRGLIHDRERIQKYGAAIRESGLYDRLGAYYINVPRPLATFEGAPPANDSMLIVRFPCLAHARAFWNSKVYQQTIVPLRRDPNAGDFTVTVYPELAPPAYMAGRVESGVYTSIPEPSIAAAIPQTPMPRRPE